PTPGTPHPCLPPAPRPPTSNHSLPGVPQFLAVGYIDGNLISRYNSETGKAVSCADWMADNLDQQYWDAETQI
uniref:MHC class I-like antigen recognition-like domain-containing protein n=1 Tax=Accipiter nisus TaxID=211598 RepID=A0A8B9MUE7_9AVES